MGSDFKPLRRKVGVVTLVTACIFLCGWIRSLTTADSVSFGHLNIYSFKQDLFLICGQDRDGFWRYTKVSWSLGLLGVRFGQGTNNNNTNSDVVYILIPYWSIVLPLTVLSAWLLLSKPRTSKPVPALERQP